MIGRRVHHSGSLWNLLNLGAPDETAWMTDALCAQTDPDAFFPERGGSTTAAKAVCAVCPVRVDCGAYALEHDERFGVWGGLSESERRKLRRAARLHEPGHADAYAEVAA